MKRVQKNLHRHRAIVDAKRRLVDQGGMTEQQAANAVSRQHAEAVREYEAQNPEYVRLQQQLAALGGVGGGLMTAAIDHSLIDRNYQLNKRSAVRVLGYIDERRHRGSTRSKPPAAAAGAVNVTGDEAQEQ
jgi:hypothetical protein